MKPAPIAALFSISLLMSGTPPTPAQESKAGQAEKPPAAAAQAETKPGLPQRPEWPKGVPHFQPLSNAEKLKIVQGVKGFPNMTIASATPYLTLYPGHLNDTNGSLILGCPYWDMLGIALYEGYECPLDTPPGGNYVDLILTADPGDNVYLIDFAVVALLGTPGVDNGIRDFRITLLTCGQNTVPPCNQPYPVTTTSPEGINHLPYRIYIPAQQSGYSYEVLLQRQVPSTGGRWYFLAVEVSKFVNAP